MLILKDVSGIQEEAFVGFKQFKRSRKANGDKSISFLAYQTDLNKHSFGLLKMESIVEFDGEEYVIKQAKKKSMGAGFYMEIKAIHRFFVDMRDCFQYKEIDGSKTFNNALTFIFEGTGYQFKIIDSFFAASIKLGKDNCLSLFKKALEAYNAEFYVIGKTVYIKHEIGSKTDFLFKYNHNVKALEVDMNTNKLSTVIRGYGGKQNENGMYPVEAEYRSPNISIYGERHAAPVYDERYTTKEGMLERLKNDLFDEIEMSIKIEFMDLRAAGYNFNMPSEGDYGFIDYEPMDMELEARIVEIEEDFDSKLMPIKTDVTISNKQTTLTDTITRFENTSKTLDSLVRGKQQLPYNALDEAVKAATKSIKSAETELKFENGIVAVNPKDTNKLVAFNSNGIGISRDGGHTFSEAITPEGIVASVGVVGQFDASNIRIGPTSVFEKGYDPSEVSQRVEEIVNNFSKDGVITTVEKKFIAAEWIRIQKEFEQLIQLSLGYWAQAVKVVERENLVHRQDELRKFLTVDKDINNNKPILDAANMIKDSVVDPAIYKARYINYYDAATKLDNKIVSRAKELADQAQKNVDDLDIKVNNIEIGWRNYLPNSNFVKATSSGRVTSKHPDFYANLWGGYNTGITNPTASYHAHVDTDTFGFNVYEFNESDGSRNWKGVTTAVQSVITESGEYRISMDAFATLAGAKVFGGFYYFKKGGNTQSFYSGQYNISDLPVDKWGRVDAKVMLNEDVDLTKPVHFYVYGYGFSSNSILYISNIKLEKGNKPTDWSPALEDINQQIKDADSKAQLVQDSVAEMSNDNKLVATEKQQLKAEWDVIVSELATVLAQADTFKITTEKNNYQDSFNALKTYIDPLLANLTTTSDITGTTLRSNIKNYYDKKTLLLKKISDETKIYTDNELKPIRQTLQNITQDGKIDVTERRYVKDKIMTIIGQVPVDTNNLPTVSVIDTSKLGEVYSCRKEALNAGILSTAAQYKAVETEYTNLKAYLEPLSPKPWDTGIANTDKAIDVVATTWRDKWLKYYLAVDALRELTAAKLKGNADEAKTEAINAAKLEAKAKADEAQAAAIKEATAKAIAAETAAKAHADGKVTAEEAARIKQANDNLAAAKKEAADKAAAAELAAKNAAALDATAKANAAKDAAINAANNNDKKIRGDMRLTSPLPSHIEMNSSGITAYAQGDPNKFARMDHRGFFAKGGAFAVERPDGALWIENGIPKFDFSVDACEPPFAGNARDQVRVEHWWYTTTYSTFQPINFYSFRRTGRYLKIQLVGGSDAGGGQAVEIVDRSGKITLAQVTHGHWIGNGGGGFEITVDMGIPTWELDSIYIKFRSLKEGVKTYIRKGRIWMEG